MRIESDIIMQGNQVKVLADAIDAADAVTKAQMDAAVNAILPVDLTSEVTGVLPVSNGGTGLSSLGSAGQVMKVNAGGTALEWGDAGGVNGSGIVDEIAVWNGASSLTSYSNLTRTPYGIKTDALHATVGSVMTSVVMNKAWFFYSGTGCVEVTLPAGTYNNTIRLEFEFFDYSSNKHGIITVDGGLFPDKWYSPHINVNADFPARVRFGYDSSTGEPKIWFFNEYDNVNRLTFILKTVYSSSNIKEQLISDVSVALTSTIAGIVQFDYQSAGYASDLVGDEIVASNKLKANGYFDGYLRYSNVILTPKYTTTGSFSSGAVKIELPKISQQNWYIIDCTVWGYGSPHAIKFQLSGFYSFTNWYGTSAIALTEEKVELDAVSVRFGKDANDYPIIWIGELTTTWTNFKVTIDRVWFQSSNNLTIDQIESGWTISMVTSFGTDVVTDNILAPQSLPTAGRVFSDQGSAGSPVIAFFDDPNTGLYSPAADSVAITTGGTERVRVDNTQTHVKQDLVVDQDATITGQLLIGNGTAGVPAIVPTSDPDTGIYFSGSGGTYISANGTNVAFFGAGTTNFYQPLYVQGLVGLNAGQTSWVDAAADPTTAGELWRNGADLVWHDGTAAVPLATESWVHDYGRKALTFNVKQYGENWIDGESVFLWRTPAWANGLRISNIEVSVITADATNNWEVVWYSQNVVGVATAFPAGTTSVSLGVSPLLAQGEIIYITLNRTSGTTGAPEGLVVVVTLEENWI